VSFRAKTAIAASVPDLQPLSWGVATSIDKKCAQTMESKEY
jgi:hypothetical protein